MQDRFHFNPNTGRAGKCGAEKQCPFNGEHFDTKAEAREAYEKTMKDANVGLNGIKAQKSIAAIEKNGEGPYVSEEEQAIRASGPPAKVYEGSGVYMNPDSVNRGDRFVSRTGVLWEASYTESLSGYSDVPEGTPPRVNLVRVNEDGTLRNGDMKKVGWGTDNLPEHFQTFKESKVDKATRLVLAEQKNPARFQTGDPMDEMIRGNIADRIRGYRKDLFNAEAAEAGLVVTEDTPESSPQRFGWESKSMVAANDPTAENGYVTEVFRGELDSREFKSYSKDGSELGTFDKLSDATQSIGVAPAPAPKVGSGKTAPITQDAEYESAVVAHIQYNKVNPGVAPKKASEMGTKTIVVPDVKNLTAKRRLEIGQELWSQSGRDMDLWGKASDEEKLRFTQTHMGRAKNLSVSVDTYGISYSHREGSGAWSSDEVTVMDLDAKS